MYNNCASVEEVPDGALYPLFGLLLLALVLLSAACGGSAASATRDEERVLRVGLPFLSQPPDPVEGGFHSIQTGLAETLFKLGKDLRPEPWLATDARQIDKKTWEITLRPGVKFHNGVSMDANAVKASLERAIAKSSRSRAFLDLAHIEVTSPLTLKIVTNHPSPILPGLLTEPSSAIADAAAAEAMGEAFVAEAVLTGPFKVERFQRDGELVGVRHTEYWGPPASVDRVIFTYLPDSSSRVLALQSGDIDIAMHVAPESVAALQSDSNLRVRPAAPIALEFMYLNHRREPWQDLRVRQAISLSIDRDALVKAVMQGQGAPAAGPLPPAMLSCPQLQGFSYNPVQARELLALAGYQDRNGDNLVEKGGQGLAMTLLTYRQRPELIPMAEVIQGSLGAIGIKVEVQMVEQIDAALEQGNWDGAVYFNNMVTTGDPYWALSQFFMTGGGVNFGRYSNPQIDELVRQVGQAADQQAREQEACKASQDIINSLPVIPLLYPNFNYGVSAKVVGFDEPHPFFLYFMDSHIGKR